MKLNVKYALYLTLVNAVFITLVLLIVGVLFWRDANDLQQKLRSETIGSYQELNQQRLLKAADYLRSSLFNPVYQLDINGIHRLFNEFELWLNIQHYHITDSSGLLLTDGSAANPNFLKPHPLPLAELSELQAVYLKPTEQGLRLIVSIEYEDQRVGYADMYLADPALALALKNQDKNLDQLWEEFNLTIRHVGLLAILITLLISIMLSLLLSRKLVAPLVQLSEEARRLADGDFSQLQRTAMETFHKSMDELAILSQSFYRMAGRLRDFFGELETEVENRTRELAEANQRIQQLNQHLESENLRMQAELDVSQRLQKMLLPRAHELSDIKVLDIAGHMAPAAEVGGDYYDVLQHNGHIICGIGDVTGHGLESGVLSLMVQSAVRTLLANQVYDPKTCLQLINYTLYNNAQRMNTEKNLTLVLLDYQQGRVRLSGQHEEILYVHADGQVERLDTLNLGFMIGLVADISKFNQQIELQLAEGEGIVLYTDGLTEAMNAQEQQYGVEQLCQVVEQSWQRSAEGVKEAILSDLQRHIANAPLDDDVTLLVLKQR